MRKKIFIIMVLLSIGLVACGSQEVNEVVENVEITENAEFVEAPVADETQEVISEDVIEEIEIIPEDASDEDVIERENTDFRNSYWGDNPEEVEKYEGDDYVVQENTYMYERKVAGYDAYAMYTFDENNELHSAMYGFADTYNLGSHYIAQYDILKEAMIEKYGEPYKDEIVPLESDSLIEMAGESSALEYGYVVYRCYWKTETTDIMLGMMSSNYKIGIMLQYNDINYEFKRNTSGL